MISEEREEEQTSAAIRVGGCTQFGLHAAFGWGDITVMAFAVYQIPIGITAQQKTSSGKKKMLFG